MTAPSPYYWTPNVLRYVRQNIKISLFQPRSFGGRSYLFRLFLFQKRSHRHQQLFNPAEFFLAGCFS